LAELDFSRWGVVARKDDSGFGRQAQMLKRALGFNRHIAIPSDRLEDHKLEGPEESWLGPNEADDRVREELDGLQGVFFFERCEWHPSLVPVAKSMQVKSVCIPNWEWFSGVNPIWRGVDYFACPSKWTAKVVQSYGFRNACFITWPLDPIHLPKRQVSGPAQLFVHNAGLVDSQDRKGTADTILAFRKVINPDIRLIVRMQKEAKLPNLDSRIQVEVGNIPDHTELYKHGDVAIQPSKMEGIGFMVLEPFCCGIPTITTDYPPMNEYVEDPRMLVKPRWRKRQAFPTQWIPHAHLRIPQTGDLARKIAWCAENDLTEISRRNREIALERYDHDKIVREWSEALEQLVK